MTRLALAFAAVCVLAGCGTTPTAGFSPAATTPSAASPSPTASQPALVQVHDPGQVTGSLTGPCHTRDGGQLPDPQCTPGAYDPAVTAAILCAPGYTTSTYRAPSSQTSAFKWHVAEPAYGQVNVAGELDHLVSLELGGANDASNLWVEAGPIPNPKDETEGDLHAWVCAAAGDQAQARLQEAQAAIAADWMTAQQALGVAA